MTQEEISALKEKIAKFQKILDNPKVPESEKKVLRSAHAKASSILESAEKEQKEQAEKKPEPVSEPAKKEHKQYTNVKKNWQV